jgi:uncharacterized RDD family membrane protein YckC
LDRAPEPRAFRGRRQGDDHAGRRTAGRLGWGTILRRWLGQSGDALVSWVPFIGSIVGSYALVDGLWPLWDDRRQALHDRLARTNVVRIR